MVFPMSLAVCLITYRLLCDPQCIHMGVETCLLYTNKMKVNVQPWRETLTKAAAVNLKL